jgi:ATP-dependent Clp protease, protease subunit
MSDHEQYRKGRDAALFRLQVIPAVALQTVESAIKRGRLTDPERRQLTEWEAELREQHFKFKAFSGALGQRVESRDYLTTSAIRNNPDWSGVFVSRDDKPVRVFAYGDIGNGPNDISSVALARAFKSIPDEATIELHVNSGGGDYRESTRMAEAISARRGLTHGYVDALAASGMTIVLMACNTISMSENSRMMIHFANGTISGNACELEAAAESLREVDKQIAANYLPRWLGTTAELVAAMANEQSFSPADAVRVGLADRITYTTAVAAKQVAIHSRMKVAAKIESPRDDFYSLQQKFSMWKRAVKNMGEE